MPQRKSRIEALEEKAAKLAEQLKAAKAREREKDRKRDTRRKIIAGAAALEHADRNPDSAFARELHRLLDQTTKRENDRALLGLPPRAGTSTSPDAPAPDNSSNPAPATPSSGSRDPISDDAPDLARGWSFGLRRS